MKQTSRVKPLYSRHPWDKCKCPDHRGILISGVNLYYKALFVTFVSVLIQGCPHLMVSSTEGFHCKQSSY